MPMTAVTNTSGALHLPAIGYDAQPAVRARRDSHLGQRAADAKSTAPAPGARRSSVAVTIAVQTGAMPMAELLQSIFACIGKSEWKHAADLVSALGRLAEAGNRPSPKSESKGSGARHHSEVSLAADFAVTTSMGEAGAVQVVIRCLAMGTRDRELCLRSLWALQHLLVPPVNRARFTGGKGMAALRAAQEANLWDEHVMTAAIACAGLVADFAAAEGVLISETHNCACRPRGRVSPGAPNAAAASDGTSGAGKGAPPPAAEEMPPPLVITPRKPVASISRGICLCACGRNAGAPLYCDSMAASCAVCSCLPWTCTSCCLSCSLRCSPKPGH
jgi:hypothetical protein